MEKEIEIKRFNIKKYKSNCFYFNEHNIYFPSILFIQQPRFRRRKKFNKKPIELL